MHISRDLDRPERVELTLRLGLPDSGNSVEIATHAAVQDKQTATMSRRVLPARALLLLVVIMFTACLAPPVAAQSVEITLNADFAAAPVLYEARYFARRVALTAGYHAVHWQCQQCTTSRDDKMRLLHGLRRAGSQSSNGTC